MYKQMLCGTSGGIAWWSFLIS